MFAHFVSHVAKTLTLSGPTGRVWYEILPQISLARDNVHLYHALLSVSAAYRFSQHPYDLQSQQQSVQYYGRCLSNLGTMNLNTPETNAAATLATVLLLCYYEVSPGSKNANVRFSLIVPTTVCRYPNAYLDANHSICAARRKLFVHVDPTFASQMQAVNCISC
jgi:hypothetical protein